MVSNFGRNAVILVGSRENELSFAENKVLLNDIFKGAFFSGKTRIDLWECVPLLTGPGGTESEVWGEITKLKRNFV